jgi:DNA-3-methyladenine glycosylase
MADHEARAVPAQGRTLTLPRSFYARPAVEVAPDLLGRTLVRLVDGDRRAGRIVETEAYEPGDPASHGFRGRTPRNGAMFGLPGHLYVYFSYGNHWMANVVTRGIGEPSAVLIRALEPLEGVSAMVRARGRDRLLELCSGPGKLARALSVDRSLDGADLVRGSEIWIESGSPTPDLVEATARVGISAGLERPWRYVLRDDPFVSRGRPGPARHSSRPRRGAPTPRS